MCLLHLNRTYRPALAHNITSATSIKPGMHAVMSKTESGPMYLICLTTVIYQLFSCTEHIVIFIRVGHKNTRTHTLCIYYGGSVVWGYFESPANTNKKSIPQRERDTQAHSPATTIPPRIQI